jgi:hypothetical protein
MLKYLRRHHISKEAIRWRCKVAKERLLRTRKQYRVLVLGDRVPWYSALWQMSGHAGIKFTTDVLGKFDIAICYCLADVRGSSDLPKDIEQRVSVINLRLHDIRKSAVQKAFADCFGYALEVNPLTYEGPLVCKSEANYAHDGHILEGPLTSDQVREGCVYQKLINAEINGGEVMDHRVVITGSVIPLVYLKYRPKTARFASLNNWAEMVETSEVFTETEQRLILKFCSHVGLDFGEIDVLRDNRDGKIYIVDITGTPGVVANHLKPDHIDCALERMAWGFRFRLVEPLIRDRAFWTYPFKKLGGREGTLA